MCASISASVKMGDASRSIPYRLNNSSSSASLLHIKKQCTAWGFEWAVERKQLVSCQGEHPEIISIIYHTDTLRRTMRLGATHTRRLPMKGEVHSRMLQMWQEKQLLFFSFFLKGVVLHMALYGGGVWINAWIFLSVLNMVVSRTLGVCVFCRKQESAY